MPLGSFILLSLIMWVHVCEPGCPSAAVLVHIVCVCWESVTSLSALIQSICRELVSLPGESYQPGRGQRWKGSKPAFQQRSGLADPQLTMKNLISSILFFSFLMFLTVFFKLEIASSADNKQHS